MQAFINGEATVVTEGATVAALVETLGLAARKIAVERNLAIVPRSLYETTSIQDGDRIEIVRFIGGG